MTERENSVREELDRKYTVLRRTLPATDPNLVYFLGDSAEWQTWSEHSGKIPTVRLNAGLFWWPALRRFSIAKEKLMFLGLPVDSSYARALGVEKVGTCDTKRASEFAGNAMHLSNIALVQLVVLSCFGETASTP